jgi:predicted CXXCH cytochrome family protein
MMKSTYLSQTIPFALVMISALLLCTPAQSAEDEDQFSHSPIRPAEKTWVVESDDGAQPIKDLTAYCLDCHGDLGESAKGKGHGSSPDVHSHPIDQPYPASGAELVPLVDLDLRLLLIDGKMTCITCHSHTEPDRRLVIPEASGQLCISCHRK